MPFSKSHKQFFVHIPKSVGSSINNMLGCSTDESLFSYNWVRNCNIQFNRKGFTNDEYIDILYSHPQHLYAKELAIMFPIEWQEYHTFTVVRNPFDRLVSEYEYIQQYPVNKSRDFKKMSFEDFVYKAFSLPIKTQQLVFDRHLDPQVEFVCDKNNIIMVDELFKYENLEPCLKRLEIITGKSRSHILKTDRKPFNEYYSKGLKEFVYNIYQNDFKVFNYSI